jgi:hypothetical protein
MSTQVMQKRASGQQLASKRQPAEKESICPPFRGSPKRKRVENCISIRNARGIIEKDN